ncbi:MAG: class I SAM-dependent methyltransferase [Pseudomonadota bacterium]
MLTADLTQFDLQAHDIVLDLGCGEGRHTNGFYWLEQVRVIGVDLSLSDLHIAKTRCDELITSPEFDTKGEAVGYVMANALTLPFSDHSFDKIICSEVLEHIHDYESVLVEINRILKPGGTLCVSVPRYWPEKICWLLSDEYHANEGGHLRIFKTSQLKSSIQQLGLTFTARHWAHALHSPFWWLKCLFWSTQDRNPLIAAYHKLLVWDLMSSPKLTRVLERLLNPVMGKSVVLYFDKPRASQA